LVGWLVGWLVVTDASGQPICPIFKDLAVPPSRAKQASIGLTFEGGTNRLYRHVSN
jgi:hypothetical protein